MSNTPSMPYMKPAYRQVRAHVIPFVSRPLTNKAVTIAMMRFSTRSFSRVGSVIRRPLLAQPQHRRAGKMSASESGPGPEMRPAGSPKPETDRGVPRGRRPAVDRPVMDGPGASLSSGTEMSKTLLWLITSVIVFIALMFGTSREMARWEREARQLERRQPHAVYLRDASGDATAESYGIRNSGHTAEVRLG